MRAAPPGLADTESDGRVEGCAPLRSPIAWRTERAGPFHIHRLLSGLPGGWGRRASLGATTEGLVPGRRIHEAGCSGSFPAAGGDGASSCLCPCDDCSWLVVPARRSAFSSSSGFGFQMTKPLYNIAMSKYQYIRPTNCDYRIICSRPHKSRSRQPTNTAGFAPLQTFVSLKRNVGTRVKRRDPAQCPGHFPKPTPPAAATLSDKSLGAILRPVDAHNIIRYLGPRGAACHTMPRQQTFGIACGGIKVLKFDRRLLTVNARHCNAVHQGALVKCSQNASPHMGLTKSALITTNPAPLLIWRKLVRTHRSRSSHSRIAARVSAKSASPNRYLDRHVARALGRSPERGNAPGSLPVGGRAREAARYTRDAPRANAIIASGGITTQRGVGLRKWLSLHSNKATMRP